VHGGLAAAQALAAEMLADATPGDPEPGSLRRSYGSPSTAPETGRTSA
jgi:hypothetical protein